MDFNKRISECLENHSFKLFRKEYIMTDQDKQKLIQKYRGNPVAFVEDLCPNIKLHEYKKVFLNTVLLKNKAVTYFGKRR